MTEELLSFDCPRCGRPSTERFWGPCGTCRVELTHGVEDNTVRQPGCICPPPYRFTDGEVYQDTTEGCPIHLPSVNQGPRGSARENARQRAAKK